MIGWRLDLQNLLFMLHGQQKIYIF